VTAVVLTPRELAVEQADVHRRHLLLLVVVGDAEACRAKQTEDRLRGDGGHVAALLIQPLRIAPLGYAVADKRQARGAECEELVRIHRKVARRPAAERRFLGAVFQEITGHPVVLP